MCLLDVLGASERSIMLVMSLLVMCLMLWVGTPLSPFGTTPGQMVALLSHNWVTIISTMESSYMARLSIVLINGEWRFSPINHILAMDLRNICSNIPLSVVDRIRWDNSNDATSLSSIWQTLRPRALRPSWIYLVWHKFSVPRFAFHIWLVLKQRLLTRDRMLRFGMNVNSGCLLCNAVLETHEHLFCDCPYTRTILASCPVPLHVTWEQFLEGNITGGTTDFVRRNVAHRFVATAYHFIWKERNLRIHNPTHRSTATDLIEAIKLKVKEKLFTCPLFKLKARSDFSLITMLC